ncbi:2-oxoglutarate dehydrogenase E1 component [Alicyclobacillaceae bacterium I2511]|nr:2-oxoglutarate dehydrogenase E1 component [Alicyclobacillaceae bacterium I2511]
MSNGYESRRAWEDFVGPNLAYVAELYEEYLVNPTAIPADVRDLFERFGNPVSMEEIGEVVQVDAWAAEQLVAAQDLMRSVRQYGHLVADTYPLKQSDPFADEGLLNPASVGLTGADLRQIPARLLWPTDLKSLAGGGPRTTNGTDTTKITDTTATGWDVYQRLLEVYTGSMAYEFAHVHQKGEREWLQDAVESGRFAVHLDAEEQRALLGRLTEVEGLETFLQRTFVGQKRFSIEGVDILVPILDELIHQSLALGTQQVMMGMAHRGRLNVLAHVLGKPYEAIFSEFHQSPHKDLVPSEGSMGMNFGWTGDVKYHLGARRTLAKQAVLQARLVLANNPSHLEFVDPVVEGYTRAAQDCRDVGGAPPQDVQAALAILVHGDASFPGEGVVAETLNLSRLPGYGTGGTVHILVNNLVGFTAVAKETRSTHYASDLAIGFEIPVIHVNADDPEACLTAASLAHAYRTEFHKDVLIEIIGYRRYGHNEMDDPMVTQPQLYAVIQNHPRVRSLYAQHLLAQGHVTEEQVSDMEQRVQARLQESLATTRDTGVPVDLPEAPGNGGDAAIETGVPLAVLQDLNTQLLKWPEGFTIYPKLDRILKRREHSFNEAGVVDWAQAEVLALATLVQEGTPIRLTGQDTERGTFSQRHLVLHDVNKQETYTPLQHLLDRKATFAVHNSPLSEASVLGFEYGYSVQAPETLVLWEAQYGDFANAAQVIIDQFLAAGHAKWRQPSGLVLLLPHGYEGQGPEHSSARLERYLQLAAENDLQVAVPTTSAQYFHLLRRQAQRLGEQGRPLVVMTPKSLLRSPRTASAWQEFTSGQFSPVLVTGSPQPTRVLLCSGKVALDLEAALNDSPGMCSTTAILRLEQLYPFPETEIAAMWLKWKNVKQVRWVQEEPRNMGAWSYVEPRIRQGMPAGMSISYVGREERSSPAEGLPQMHEWAQSKLLQGALSEDITVGSNERPNSISKG